MMRRSDCYDAAHFPQLTSSGIGTQYARLIHGTLRRKSRCNERTRGPVSVMEAEKGNVFCTLLRSATAPDDAPVAKRDADIAGHLLLLKPHCCLALKMGVR